MKKNKMFKIMLTVLMLIVMVGTAGSVLAAGWDEEITASEPGGNVGTSINNIASQILFVVQMIAIAVATIMLIVLGIKYITASPDGKAEIKKSAWIYVVGAFAIFASSFLVGLLKNLFTGLK